MKNSVPYYFFLLLLVTAACTDKKEKVEDIVETKLELTLPFQSLALNDLSDFKTGPENWQIVASVFADRSQEKTLGSTNGSGVLANMSTKNKEHLITLFEHGDIVFECDVMLPVASNSGIYFQSRYELQLFDSWGVDIPKYGDMGGIYQRWDKTKEKGKEGFEGYAPKVNAAKAPGLWQHLKVIFHAPQFDESGNKIKNAWFEEVRLNGALIHQNVVVSGPTRGGIETKEVSKAPILIQGDHGAVAFKNIKYKLFENHKVELSEVTMKEYENTLSLLPNLDSLVPIREIRTDSISATMATGVRPQKLLSYEGKLKIPKSGDYLFDYKINRSGGALLISNDTIISMNGNYSLDSVRISKVSLEKGDVPFQLIYNKHVPWQIGFGLFVEGPGVQKHALHAPSSLILPSEEINPEYMINVTNEPVTQRGFWMHEGNKRTHCIAVGYSVGLNYVYDLASGSLLQVWSGNFMDATKMWQGRGEKQLGAPAGFIVSLHGNAELAVLNDDETIWPTSVSNSDYKQLGYQFDANGFPNFDYQIAGSIVSNKFEKATVNRGLTRQISINGSKDLWFKIADGINIQELPDGTFVVNDESYFIDMGNSSLKPKIRKSNGLDELVIKIPSGEQQLEYSIIW